MDAVSGATPLGLVKEGLGNGESMDSLMANIPSYFEMFMGNSGGSLGEVSALFLLLGGIFLLYKKVITWQIPVSFLGSGARFCNHPLAC